MKAAGIRHKSWRQVPDFQKPRFCQESQGTCTWKRKTVDRSHTTALSTGYSGGELVPEENDYKLAHNIHSLPGGYQEGLLGHPPAAQADSLQVTAQAANLPKPEDQFQENPELLWYKTGS